MPGVGPLETGSEVWAWRSFLPRTSVPCRLERARNAQISFTANDTGTILYGQGTNEAQLTLLGRTAPIPGSLMEALDSKRKTGPELHCVTSTAQEAKAAFKILRERTSGSGKQRAGSQWTPLGAVYLPQLILTTACVPVPASRGQKHGEGTRPASERASKWAVCPGAVQQGGKQEKTNGAGVRKVGETERGRLQGHASPGR